MTPRAPRTFRQEARGGDRRRRPRGPDRHPRCRRPVARAGAAVSGRSARHARGAAYRYSDGAAYTSAGGYTTSFDKGTGLVDVVAAVGRLTGA